MDVPPLAERIFSLESGRRKMARVEREERLLRLGLDAAYGIVRSEEWVRPLLAGVGTELGIDSGLGLAEIVPPRAGLRHPDWPAEAYVARPAGADVRITMHGAPDMTPTQAQAAFTAASQDVQLGLISTGQLTCTSRTSEHVRMREFWTTEAYDAMHGIYDGRYPAAVPLGSAGQRTYFVGLHRHSRDFSDEDIRVLDGIRPPITAALTFRARLDAAVKRIGQLAGTAAASPDGCEESSLTERQRQVMVLVAAGWTNQQIARRLGITERTVRKHVADIFDRMSVHSRAAAASRWQGIHLDQLGALQAPAVPVLQTSTTQARTDRK